MKGHSSLSQVDKDEVDWLLATAFLAFPPLLNTSASLNVTKAKVTLQDNLELRISSETRSHDTQALTFQIRCMDGYLKITTSW